MALKEYIGESRLTEILNNLKARVMVGATSSKAGTSGWVPAPTIADRLKFLRGDGSWQSVSGSSSGVFYGTCTGCAALQEKSVTISSDQSFELKVGSMVAVKFDANNTYSAKADNPIKLNVNGTGAKQIYGANNAAPTGTNTTYFGRVNYINQYIYDGTYWVWAGSSTDNNTTYSTMPLSEMTTGTATNARSVRSDYLKSGIETIAGNKINPNIATIETSPTGAAHSVGEYIIYNGALYEVTADIAKGDTLTVGTNIKETTVGGELTEINSFLDDLGLSVVNGKLCVTYEKED